MNYREISRRFFLILLLSAVAVGQNSTTGRASRSSESSSKPHKKPSSESAGPDFGTLSDGVYHNVFFGFRYKTPFGWVDRTAGMREGSAPGNSMVLLATFERPPQAAGETINSAVVVAAESVAAYPGLKTAAQYFEPLTELTTAKGFTVVNQPYEFPLGARSLVRGDFSKNLGKVKMLQSTLVTLQKGYVLSFTFIAGDEEEIEKLIEGLNFAGLKARANGQSSTPH